jgi:hypothetical protein
VDAADAAFLAPEDKEQHKAAILKQLDRIDTRLDRIEQDIMITSETLAPFIRYFLTVTPRCRSATAPSSKRRDGSGSSNS